MKGGDGIPLCPQGKLATLLQNPGPDHLLHLLFQTLNLVSWGRAGWCRATGRSADKAEARVAGRE